MDCCAQHGRVLVYINYVCKEHVGIIYLDATIRDDSWKYYEFLEEEVTINHFIHRVREAE